MSVLISNHIHTYPCIDTRKFTDESDILHSMKCRGWHWGSKDNWQLVTKTTNQSGSAYAPWTSPRKWTYKQVVSHHLNFDHMSAHQKAHRPDCRPPSTFYQPCQPPQQVGISSAVSPYQPPLSLVRYVFATTDMYLMPARVSLTVISSLNKGIQCQTIPPYRCTDGRLQR